MNANFAWAMVTLKGFQLWPKNLGRKFCKAGFLRDYSRKPRDYSRLKSYRISLLLTAEHKICHTVLVILSLKSASCAIQTLFEVLGFFFWEHFLGSAMPIMLLGLVMVVLCSMKAVECSEIGGNELEDGITPDQEIYALCSLNPFLNICYGTSITYN